MSLLEQAMSPDILNSSWKRLHNEHTPWSLNVSRDDLQKNLLKHLLACREQVLSGNYKPLPLRQFALTKPNGKQRVISAQYLQDKVIQRALLTVLEPRAEAVFHDDSYAYRPHRGVAQALRKVHERVKIGQDWLVDADIEQFFDSIPHTPLIKILKKFIDDHQTMQVVEMWLKQGAHCSSLLGSRRGIAQGAVLSPLFCNLYLHEFDKALSDANIPFVRFADDFLLFANAKSKAEEEKLYAEKQLNKLGLKLHPEKTQITRSHSRVIFLGEALPNPVR
jgi:group II intron reverse transcriptase/maturase